ncbi:MAG: hypothetical protein BAJALOKI1v1_280003 [Promethearchaeota archaeon]|nr:MAG: hypothetical protein BAJALOKI1v1_280003 [Candidatus Lokiarchaeota archaeon]
MVRDKKNKVEIKKDAFADPMKIINEITPHLNLEYTKVIQTYVIENKDLELVLKQEGAPDLRGKLVWLGKRKDGKEGTVLCIKVNSEIQKLNPTPENIEKVFLDLKKERILLHTESKAKCAVCEKKIEIYDEVKSCPICGARAHKDHFLEWIRMKANCPVCKKALNISSAGKILVV